MKNAKIHTSSFFLETQLLVKIDTLAEILGVSRSILVERAIFGKEKGFDNAERKIKPKKTKKKIPTKRVKYKAYKQKCKKAEVKQECLFSECD